MVKNYNDSDLEGRNIFDKYYLFIQVWKELTERKTMDTYQYRIMNTFSILHELNRYIDFRINQIHTTNNNLKTCLNEAKSIIKKDTVIKEKYPSIYRRLQAHLNTKVETNTELTMLHFQIEYCYRILSKDYHLNLFDLLKEAIDKSDDSKIVELTGNLVSLSVFEGWSVIELSQLEKLFYNSDGGPEQAWETFVERLLTHETSDYIICIPINIRSNLLTHKSSNSKDEFYHYMTSKEIKIYNGSHLAKKLNNEICFKQEKKYAIIREKAYDQYAASREALEKYSEILNLMSFYSIIKPPDFSNIKWIVIKDHDCKQMRLSDLDNAYEYIEGVMKVYKAAKNVEKEGNNDIKKKLHAVYAYANMGKLSYNLTNRFINTWIALESLCRTNIYPNIIANVLETVPAALCIRYIYKLYRNFIEDCFRCKVDLEEFGISRNKIESKEKKVKRIICIMSDSNQYAQLDVKCSVNKLLRYRCHEMKKILSDPTVMYDKIAYHYANVKNQLSRLYTIRNELAHSAAIDSEISNLLRCTEHLEDYLASFVSEILHCLSNEKNKNCSLEEIFEIIKNNYADFQNISSAKKKLYMDDILKESLLQTGVIDLIK